MTQGRVMSGVEAITNVVVGWVVALGTQALVFPVMGLSVTVAQHLGIGAAFTAVSLVRNYLVRRVFARLATVPPGGGSISVTSIVGPAGAGRFFHGQNSDRGSKGMKGR